MIKKELEAYPDIIFKIDDDSSFVQIKLIKAKTTQETKEKLSTKEKVFNIIAENKNITRLELASIIGVSEKAIKQHLANLKKEGVLKRVGSTKSGYWKVKL